MLETRKALQRFNLFFECHPVSERLLVFTIGVSFIGIINLIFGWGGMTGDSRFYSSVSHQFEREGWEVFQNTGIPFYYRLFPSLLWLCRWISEDQWQAVFSVFQCFVCGAYFLGVFQLSSQVFKKEYVGWLAILLLFPLYEFWNWSRFILTDIIFSTSLIWFLYFVLKLQFETRRVFNLMSVIFCLSIVILMRPVGLFAVFSVSLYGLYLFLRAKFSSRIGVGVVCCVIALMLGGGIMSYVGLPEDFGMGTYRFFRSLFEEGVVVHDRSYYDISYPQWLLGSPLGVFIAYSFLVISRFVLFWSPVITGYSLVHLGFNLISMIPLYIFALLKPPSTGKSFLWITLFSFTAFHSLTLIDYDHRYRVPLLGLVVVLAAGGFSTLIEKYISTDQTP